MWCYASHARRGAGAKHFYGGVGYGVALRMRQRSGAAKLLQSNKLNSYCKNLTTTRAATRTPTTTEMRRRSLFTLASSRNLTVAPTTAGTITQIMPSTSALRLNISSSSSGVGQVGSSFVPQPMHSCVRRQLSTGYGGGGGGSGSGRRLTLLQKIFYGAVVIFLAAWGLVFGGASVHCGGFSL